MKILSIIPARSGSKGIKNKNIVDLATKPLIAWTIEASLKSKHISKTVVSSDSNEILQISKKYGAQTILRPAKLALDSSASEPLIKHILDTLEDIAKFDFLILLQPTSPLRDKDDIDSAIELLLSQNATSLISVKEIDNKILKAFKKNPTGSLEAISNKEYPFMPRQNLPRTYMPNGAIYLISIKEFLKNEKLMSSRCIPYIMSDEKSLDIDTLEDLNKCNEIIKQWSSNEKY